MNGHGCIRMKLCFGRFYQQNKVVCSVIVRIDKNLKPSSKLLNFLH